MHFLQASVPVWQADSRLVLFFYLFSRGRPVIVPAAGKRPNEQETTGIGVPLEVKGHVIGALILESGPARRPFEQEELEALTTLSNQATVAIENAWLYESVKNNYFATIQSLVNALEASDRFTRGHSERVRLLSVGLGKHLGLDFRELELLEHAAILHDIGKIGIDNFVLQKQGKLTSREYGLVKTHPLIGDEILGPIENLEAVRKTIIQHHERYDGTGYPYGLRGNEISLKSRVLSVVGTFDAMMTDRPYRRALDLNQVKEELKANAGTSSTWRLCRHS
ncbi:MAG: HD domain-containing phosphohydrolase [Candidatus Sulfobium sp.]